jgi:hypothetical protein
MGYFRRFLIVSIFFGELLFAGPVHAEGSALNLVLKDSVTKNMFAPHGGGLGMRGSFTESRSFDSPTLTETWCKHVTLTYWSNSRHPGYSYAAHQHINQNQDGIGVKCRKDGENPEFASLDAMKNSRFGVTMAASLGKELDLINWHGIRYYYGISITALSYEMPEQRRTVYGLAPIMHRGVSLDLSALFSVQLPRNFTGKLGWEELRLPVDNIRVRNWNAAIRMEF